MQRSLSQPFIVCNQFLFHHKGILAEQNNNHRNQDINTDSIDYLHQRNHSLAQREKRLTDTGIPVQKQAECTENHRNGDFTAYTFMTGRKKQDQQGKQKMLHTTVPAKQNHIKHHPHHGKKKGIKQSTLGTVQICKTECTHIPHQTKQPDTGTAPDPADHQTDTLHQKIDTHNQRKRTHNYGSSFCLICILHVFYNELC